MTIEARAEELVASASEAGFFPGLLARAGYLGGGVLAMQMAGPPLAWGLRACLDPHFAAVGLANVGAAVGWALLGGLLLQAAVRGVHPRWRWVLVLLAVQLGLGLAVGAVFGFTPWTLRAHLVVGGLAAFTVAQEHRLRRALALPVEPPALYLE